MGCVFTQIISFFLLWDTSEGRVVLLNAHLHKDSCSFVTFMLCSWRSWAGERTLELPFPELPGVRTAPASHPCHCIRSTHLLYYVGWMNTQPKLGYFASVTVFFRSETDLSLQIWSLLDPSVVKSPPTLDSEDFCSSIHFSGWWLHVGSEVAQGVGDTHSVIRQAWIPVEAASPLCCVTWGENIHVPHVPFLL